jgi:hypothetical protein
MMVVQTENCDPGALPPTLAPTVKGWPQELVIVLLGKKLPCKSDKAGHDPKLT